MPSFCGVILAAGESSRMGRDKALLPIDGATLIERVASRVQLAAGQVSIIAPPDRYRHLRYPVIADVVENCGPLGGVFTALSITESPWNLVVACDMPALTVGFLENLFRAAETRDGGDTCDAVVPESAAGLDPLCAVYHRRCLEKAVLAIDRKILKMHDFVSTLQIRRWPVLNARPLENINTPDQWPAQRNDRRSAR